jgi:hypothetical protein
MTRRLRNAKIQNAVTQMPKALKEALPENIERMFDGTYYGYDNAAWRWKITRVGQYWEATPTIQPDSRKLVTRTLAQMSKELWKDGV